MTQAAVNAVLEKEKPRWLSKREAASRVGVSTDTIERRAIPWQEQPVIFKVRYKLLQLGPDSDPVPRFFEADVEALLYDPPKRDSVPASGPLRGRNRVVRLAKA